MSLPSIRFLSSQVNPVLVLKQPGDDLKYLARQRKEQAQQIKQSEPRKRRYGFQSSQQTFSQTGFQQDTASKEVEEIEKVTM